MAECSTPHVGPDICGLKLRAQTAQLATRLSNPWFVLSQALAYISLSLLHLRHSLPALEQGRAFPPLDGHPEANVIAEILHFLTLSYLFAIYALSLYHWSRLHFKARELVWAGSTGLERFAGQLDGYLDVCRLSPHRRHLQR